MRLLPLSCQLLCAGVSLAAAFLAPAVVESRQQEKFTGFAINTNSGPSTATVDFTVTRWSTDAERAQLLAIIKENKDPTDKLLRALQKLPKVGYIRTPDRLAWDLHYARQSPLDEGGRQIVLATDRPIGFWEARNQPRSYDYPFTIVQVHLDRNDTGSGKILAGTKIYIDKKNNLVLENFAQQPVRFNEIKRVK
ncbi:MAG TPA: hypothetical protein VN716_29945 [Vicinamibacterales bacterium]|jgi:hypothetical protein|nr:hypothetical protein [Vicinamibacterales bacterium]